MFSPIKNLDEYYDRMYDIENLTELNKKAKPEKDELVIEVEELVRSGQAVKARNLIDKLSLHRKNFKFLMIKKAMEAFDLIGSDFYLGKGERRENLSPKIQAIRELQKFTGKSFKAVEKKMKVEEPVAKDWNRRHPNIQSEESINDFYIKTDSYIYELMAANNIVQTLYSYKIMLEKIKTLRVGKILDYGAGAGTICIMLKNAGYEVVYSDLGSKTFDFAKWRINKRKLKIKTLNLTKYPLLNKYCFDCVISTEVIEHVLDPIGLVKKFSEILPKGGILVVSESCKYTREFSSHLESNKKYGGKKFLAILKEHGFKQILPKPVIPQLFFKKFE